MMYQYADKVLKQKDSRNYNTITDRLKINKSNFQKIS